MPDSLYLVKENVPRCCNQYFKGLQSNQEIYLRKTLSKLKNLILLFSVAINDRINKYHAVPEVKANYKVAVDMSDKEGIDEV